MACEECDGLGLRRVANGMAPCGCQERRKSEQAIERAHVPARYRAATLASFQLKDRDSSIVAAHLLASTYVREWSPSSGSGLLLAGSVGTGKTHLATAMLLDLVQRGARGVFTDVRTLLKSIQATYSPGAEQTEAQVLTPVLSADVVVFDELGAMRSTDWVSDAIEYVLNSRYNASLPTIITTNYPLQAPRRLKIVSEEYQGYERRAPNVQESLADRIGVRMVSRLHEMCRLVPMTGEDYRMRFNQSDN